MAEYDFHKLNPLDFERMCCELLHIRYGHLYHTAKEGPDGGIDILTGDDLANVVVFQCKRYGNRNDLMHSLLHDELQKVKRLNPTKYGLITSLKLKAQDKQGIKDIFAPYIKSLDDIVDGCDLNAWLECDECENIINHYPALWLSGFQVLKRAVHNDVIGRSDDFTERTLAEMKGVVWTDVTEAAYKRLEMEHVVVLTGDPGVGKTVSAKMLFTRCISQGFEPVVTFRDITELERLFVSGQKQVFFFDDFLGQQLLEAALRQNDRGVCEFIRRVQGNVDKRFILTSRTVIINSGISTAPILKNFWRVVPSYFCFVEGYSNIDRARILYTLMSRSLLPSNLLGQLLKERSYWKIIEHRNFNPRIVDLILSNGMVRKLKCEDNLLDVLIAHLDAPNEVWKDAFEHTLTPEERFIVWCVFLNPRIEESGMREIYANFLMMRGSETVGDVSFEKSIETLSESMLTRTLDFTGKATYALRNPSVGDFLMSRIGEDLLWTRDVLISSNNYRVVDKFRELARHVACNKNLLSKVLLSVAQSVELSKSIDFVIAVWRALLECDTPNACLQISKSMMSDNIEQYEVKNCDSLIYTLSSLDDNGVDLVRKCRLSLSPNLMTKWISGCEKFESAAYAYKLIVKYQFELPSDMSKFLTDRMKEKAWEIAGELHEPEYVRDEYGRAYIADGEEEWLRECIEGEVRKLLKEFSIPESMVDVWDCSRDPDLNEIFQPPSDHYNYSDSRSYSQDGMQERMEIDSLFDQLRKKVEAL